MNSGKDENKNFSNVFSFMMRNRHKQDEIIKEISEQESTNLSDQERADTSISSGESSPKNKLRNIYQFLKANKNKITNNSSIETEKIEIENDYPSPLDSEPAVLANGLNGEQISESDGFDDINRNLELKLSQDLINENEPLNIEETFKEEIMECLSEDKKKPKREKKQKAVKATKQLLFDKQNIPNDKISDTKINSFQNAFNSFVSCETIPNESTQPIVVPEKIFRESGKSTVSNQKNITNFFSLFNKKSSISEKCKESNSEEITFIKECNLSKTMNEISRKNGFQLMGSENKINDIKENDIPSQNKSVANGDYNDKKKPLQNAFGLLFNNQNTPSENKDIVKNNKDQEKGYSSSQNSSNNSKLINSNNHPSKKNSDILQDCNLASPTSSEIKIDSEDVKKHPLQETHDDHKNQEIENGNKENKSICSLSKNSKGKGTKLKRLKNTENLPSQITDIPSKDKIQDECDDDKSQSLQSAFGVLFKNKELENSNKGIKSLCSSSKVSKEKVTLLRKIRIKSKSPSKYTLINNSRKSDVCNFDSENLVKIDTEIENPPSKNAFSALFKNLNAESENQKIVENKSTESENQENKEFCSSKKSDKNATKFKSKEKSPENGLARNSGKLKMDNSEILGEKGDTINKQPVQNAFGVLFKNRNAESESQDIRDNTESKTLCSLSKKSKSKKTPQSTNPLISNPDNLNLCNSDSDSLSEIHNVKKQQLQNEDDDISKQKSSIHSSKNLRKNVTKLECKKKAHSTKVVFSNSSKLEMCNSESESPVNNDNNLRKRPLQNAFGVLFKGQNAESENLDFGDNINNTNKKLCSSKNVKKAMKKSHSTKTLIDSYTKTLISSSDNSEACNSDSDCLIEIDTEVVGKTPLKNAFGVLFKNRDTEPENQEIVNVSEEINAVHSSKNMKKKGKTLKGKKKLTTKKSSICNSSKLKKSSSDSETSDSVKYDDDSDNLKVRHDVNDDPKVRPKQNAFGILFKNQNTGSENQEIVDVSEEINAVHSSKNTKKKGETLKGKKKLTTKKSSIHNSSKLRKSSSDSETSDSVKYDDDSDNLKVRLDVNDDPKVRPKQNAFGILFKNQNTGSENRETVAVNEEIKTVHSSKNTKKKGKTLKSKKKLTSKKSSIHNSSKQKMSSDSVEYDDDSKDFKVCPKQNAFGVLKNHNTELENQETINVNEEIKTVHSSKNAKKHGKPLKGKKKLTSKKSSICNSSKLKMSSGSETSDSVEYDDDSEDFKVRSKQNAFGALFKNCNTRSENRETVNVNEEIKTVHSSKNTKKNDITLKGKKKLTSKKSSLRNSSKLKISSGSETSDCVEYDDDDPKVCPKQNAFGVLFKNRNTESENCETVNVNEEIKTVHSSKNTKKNDKPLKGKKKLTSKKSSLRNSSKLKISSDSETSDCVEYDDDPKVCHDDNDDPKVCPKQNAFGILFKNRNTESENRETVNVNEEIKTVHSSKNTKKNDIPLKGKKKLTSKKSSLRNSSKLKISSGSETSDCVEYDDDDPKVCPKQNAFGVLFKNRNTESENQETVNVNEEIKSVHSTKDTKKKGETLKDKKKLTLNKSSIRNSSKLKKSSDSETSDCVEYDDDSDTLEVRPKRNAFGVLFKNQNAKSDKKGINNISEENKKVCSSKFLEKGSKKLKKYKNSDKSPSKSGLLDNSNDIEMCDSDAQSSIVIDDEDVKKPHQNAFSALFKSQQVEDVKEDKSKNLKKGSKSNKLSSKKSSVDISHSENTVEVLENNTRNLRSLSKESQSDMVNDAQMLDESSNPSTHISEPLENSQHNKEVTNEATEISSDQNEKSVPQKSSNLDEMCSDSLRRSTRIRGQKDTMKFLKDSSDEEVTKSNSRPVKCSKDKKKSCSKKEKKKTEKVRKKMKTSRIESSSSSEDDKIEVVAVTNSNKSESVKMAPIFVKKKGIPLSPTKARAKSDFLTFKVEDSIIKTCSVKEPEVPLYCPLPRFTHIKQECDEDYSFSRSTDVSLKEETLFNDIYSCQAFRLPKESLNSSSLACLEQFPSINMATLCHILAYIKSKNKDFPVMSVFNAYKKAKEDYLKVYQETNKDNQIKEIVNIDSDVNLPQDSSKKTKRKKKAGKSRLKRRKISDESFEEVSESSESLPWVQNLPYEWTQVFAPRSSDLFIGNSGPLIILKEWLKNWRTASRKDVPEKRGFRRVISEESWDGNSSDASDASLVNSVLITGPSGVGKTAAVYALAHELGYKVLEVNASSPRPGKVLLSQLSEATQSHNVSSGNIFTNSVSTVDELLRDSDQAESSKAVSLILIEDIDLVFGEADEGFIAAVNNLMTTSKRPIVLTVSLDRSSSESVFDRIKESYMRVDLVFPEPELIELQILKCGWRRAKPTLILATYCTKMWPRIKESYMRVDLFFPEPELIAQYLQLMCLANGVFASSKDLEILVRSNNEDIRSTILDLQFWGLSGSTQVQWWKMDNDKILQAALKSTSPGDLNIKEVIPSVTSISSKSIEIPISPACIWNKTEANLFKGGSLCPMSTTDWTLLSGNSLCYIPFNTTTRKRELKYPLRKDDPEITNSYLLTKYRWLELDDSHSEELPTKSQDYPKSAVLDSKEMKSTHSRCLEAMSSYLNNFVDCDIFNHFLERCSAQETRSNSWWSPTPLPSVESIESSTPYLSYGNISNIISDIASSNVNIVREKIMQELGSSQSCEDDLYIETFEECLQPKFQPHEFSSKRNHFNGLNSSCSEPLPYTAQLQRISLSTEYLPFIRHVARTDHVGHSLHKFKMIRRYLKILPQLGYDLPVSSVIDICNIFQ